MFKNYLKIAWRNILKYKLNSGINILGLALGIASFLVVLLFLKNEFGMDQFNLKKDRIYRLNHKDWSILGTIYADLVRDNFPEVEGVTRFDVWNAGSVVFKRDDLLSKVDQVVFADQPVFDIFTFPFIQGNPEDALSQPMTLVLTQSTARRIFGDENPVGQVLRYNNQFDLMVTGVIQDVGRSHLPLNAIISFNSLTAMTNDAHFLERFDAWNYPTFLLIRPGTDVRVLESKINRYFSQYESFFWNKEEGPQFHLQSLNDIYFDTSIKYGYGLHGSKQRISLVVALALFILLIASFNFINLSTARASMRTREVGIRKVLGAYRLRLVFQMLSESILMCALAFVLAFGLAELCLPFLNPLFGTALSLSDFHFTEILGTVFLGIFVLGICAGIYPALQLTSFNPAAILKTSKNKDKRSVLLRRFLTGFQFALSAMLIIGTFVISKQLHYLKNKNLGFDQSHILVVPLNKDLTEHWQMFKNRLVSDPGIENVSFSHFTLGNVGWIQNWDVNGAQIRSNLLHVDPEFVSCMGIELADGRNFSREMQTDEWNSFVINEEMARQLGPGPVIGRKLGNGTIIGVAKDFNFNSLRSKITPLVLIWGNSYAGFANIKIAPNQTARSIHLLESLWKELSPEFPFEYSFLDKRIENIYQSEQRLSTIFSTFSGMALMIACIGLLGLSAFLVAHRTREVALRKVFGASIPRIVMFLSREFAVIVLISNLVAWPVIYWISNKLLESFAYHTTIDWWIFLLAGGVTLAIALLTVSWQVIRAATANPIHSLRYE